MKTKVLVNYAVTGQQQDHVRTVSYPSLTVPGHVGCQDNLILGKSPIKRRQHPDMTIAVEGDIQHPFDHFTSVQCGFEPHTGYI